MRRRREKVELTGDEEQFVTFRLGKETFAVDISQAREIGKVKDITRVPKMPEHIVGVMNLRGQVTTVIDLKKRFKISRGHEDGDDSQARIIVVEIGEIQLAIIVDSVEDVVRISRQNISAPPESLQTEIENGFLAGICKLPGKLVLLLDLGKIFSGGDMAIAPLQKPDLDMGVTS